MYGVSMNRIRHVAGVMAQAGSYDTTRTLRYPRVAQNALWIVDSGGFKRHMLSAFYFDLPPAWDPEALYFIDITIDVV